jgi:23S rRNA U2552 (ribose-2'-O)-methylase RlmE/FtsJ
MEVSSFEWFTLETKVRSLFLELIEPITKRFADQKIQDQQFQEILQAHKHRFESHDLELERFSNKCIQVDELIRKQTSFENSQRVLDTKIAEELSTLQLQLGSVSSSILGFTSSLRSTDTQLETLHKSSKATAHELMDVKTTFLEKLQQIRINVDAQIKDCVDEVKSYGGIFKEANSNYESLNASIVSVDIKTMSCVQELKFIQLDLQRLKKDEALKERLVRIEDSVMKTRQISANEIREQEKAISKLQGQLEQEAVRTQLKISEVLHRSLQGPSKKALTEYEMQTFAELSTLELGSLKDLIAEAQLRAAEVHEAIVKEEEEKLAKRVVKNLRSRLHSRGRNVRTESTPAAELIERALKHTANVQDSGDQGARVGQMPGPRAQRDNRDLNYDESLSRTDDAELDYSDQGSFDEFDFPAFRQDIMEEVKADTDDIRATLRQIHDDLREITSRQTQGEVETGRLAKEIATKTTELRKTVSESTAHLESIVSTAIDKCEAVSSQRKRDHSEYLTEIHKASTEIENLIDEQSKSRAYSKTIGQMTTSVVEFCRITQALFAQDEEDRQSIALMGYKEGRDSSRAKTRTGAVVTLDKQCISCTNQTPVVLSAFKMACLAYAPTPISYMKQSLTRRELIEMQGQLLNSSWDKVSSHFKLDTEVLKDQIERLSTSVSRVSTSIPRPRSSHRPAKLFTPAPAALSRPLTVSRGLQSPHLVSLVDFTDDLPMLTLGRRISQTVDRQL